MRVISGKAGGIPLLVPDRIARPTTDRVRESVFSTLMPWLEGARVLDLFAGSGALGLESLSRGAAEVAFVDDDRAACATIRENLAKTRLAGGTVHQRNVFTFLRDLPEAARFDLIFADPPYARDEVTGASLENLLASEPIAAALDEEGLFVLESFARKPLPESPLWTMRREKTYGDTRVSYLVR